MDDESDGLGSIGLLQKGWHSVLEDRVLAGLVDRHW